MFLQNRRLTRSFSISQRIVQMQRGFRKTDNTEERKEDEKPGSERAQERRLDIPLSSGVTLQPPSSSAPPHSGYLGFLKTIVQCHILVTHVLNHLYTDPLASVHCLLSNKIKRRIMYSSAWGSRKVHPILKCLRRSIQWAAFPGLHRQTEWLSSLEDAVSCKRRRLLAAGSRTPFEKQRPIKTGIVLDLIRPAICRLDISEIKHQAPITVSLGRLFNTFGVRPDCMHVCTRDRDGQEGDLVPPS